MLLVFGLDVLVVDGIAGLCIDPTRVRLALERSVVILDEAHDPSHLNAAFQTEFAVCFHLPAGAGVAPRTNFSKSSDDDNLFKINHSFEVGIERLDLSVPVRQFREIEFDVGASLNFDR